MDQVRESVAFMADLHISRKDEGTTVKEVGQWVSREIYEEPIGSPYHQIRRADASCDSLMHDSC